MGFNLKIEKNSKSDKFTQFEVPAGKRTIHMTLNLDKVDDNYRLKIVNPHDSYKIMDAVQNLDGKLQQIYFYTNNKGESPFRCTVIWMTTVLENNEEVYIKLHIVNKLGIISLLNSMLSLAENEHFQKEKYFIIEPYHTPSGFGACHVYTKNTDPKLDKDLIQMAWKYDRKDQPTATNGDWSPLYNFFEKQIKEVIHPIIGQ